MNMNTVLFITDGSILNPILHSQGIPLLEYIADKGYKPMIFSREKKQENLLSNLESKHHKIVFFHSFESQNTHKPVWLFNLFSDIRLIKKIIYSQKVKLIHCRSLIPAMLGYYFKLSTFGKIQLIYDNRGLRILEEIQSGHWKAKSVKVRFFSMIEKKILKSSDAVVVVSDFFKSYLLSLYGVKNFANKIFVISNRTEINLNFNRDSKIKSNEVPICVYSGSAAKWQSLEELEKVFKVIKSCFQKIKILILTYHINEFEKILSSSDLRDSVTLKEVPPENVFEELKNCSFGILIRNNDLINNVSSPLKFAEYLSAGLPVLISEGIGDTKKIVENNRIGVVIKNDNYQDAIIEMRDLLNDPVVYNRCRQIAKMEFNIITSFEQYLNIYQKLLNDE